MLIIETKNNYKKILKNKGYSKKEIKIIKEQPEEQIKNIINLKFNPNIINFITEKYYIMKNLEKYLEYQQREKDMNFKDIVSVINVGADHEWYDELQIKKTDLSKNELILVNKFNVLDKYYQPNDIIKIPDLYCSEPCSCKNIAYKSSTELIKAAEEASMNIKINSVYRPYSEQDELYQEFLEIYGQEYTDKFAARPGHSEHQTGLAFDISHPDANKSNYMMFKETSWLMDNAYKFGFILRYPQGKEFITGYNYEPWHFRYVGKEIAKFIHENCVTFDEYHAYYLK